MTADIDQKLARYSEIDFHNDLKNFERDVNIRLYREYSGHINLKNLIERWSGIPFSISAGTLASTLILGIFLGAQMQGEIVPAKSDILGFDIFSATNSRLPSSLLTPKK